MVRSRPEHTPSVLLGTFAIERVLQSSRTAEVYRARDLRLQRPVCLKILRSKGAGQAEREALYSEARLACSLRSAYAVRVFYSDDLPGGMFFAMEWADGGSLADWLVERGPMKAPEVRQTLIQVCDALGEAHRAGLLHRDIKPANLLVFTSASGPPVVKLADFGIAAPLQRSRALRSVVGTPGYMAPEVWNGHGASAASDMYALGATAYKLWTGKDLFETDGSLQGWRDAHLHAPVLPPGRRGADFDEALQSALLGCLAKSPAERPQSTEEMLALLGHHPRPDDWLPSMETDRSPRGAVAADLTRTETQNLPERLSASADESSHVAPSGTQVLPSLRSQHLVVVVALLAPGSSPPAAAAGLLTPLLHRGGHLLEGIPAAVDGRALAVWAFPGQADAPRTILRAARAAAEVGYIVWVDVVRAVQSAGGHPQLNSSQAESLLRSLRSANAPLTFSPAFERWNDTHYQHQLAERVHGALGRAGSSLRWTPRSLPTGAPALIGRSAELEELSSAVVEALATGAPTTAWVEAEAGLGKTRLLWELARQLEGEVADIRVVSVWAQLEEQASDGALLRRIFGALFSLGSGLSRTEVEERLAQHLRGAGSLVAGAVARDVAVWLAPEVSETLDESAAAAQSARALRAMREALDCLGSDQSVLLLLDDLHWADHASLTLIGEWLRAAQGARVALVAASRPLADAALAALQPELRLRLAKLGDASALRLLRSLMAKVEGLTESALDRLARAAEGSPLFAEELVQWLIHSGGIAPGPQGRLRLEHHPEAGLPVSPTMEALVSARLELLPHSEQFALRAAAVLGSGFPRAALDYLLGDAERTLELTSALDALVAHGLLVRRAEGADACYAFAHSLQEEVVYLATCAEDRAAWHERAAEWLEGILVAAPSHPCAAQAARHWQRAGHPVRAALAWQRAGELARSSFAMAEAYRLYGLAAHAYPRARAHQRARLVCHWHRARAAVFLGKAAELADEVARLRELIGEAKSASAELKLWKARAGYLEAISAARRGDWHTSAALSEAALASLLAPQASGKGARQPAEVSEAAAVLGNWLGWSRLRAGQAHEALSAYDEALVRLSDRPTKHLRERSTLQSARALALAQLDAAEDDVADAHRAAISHKERLARRTGDHKPLGASLINFASFLVDKGRVAEAEPVLVRAQELAQRLNDPEMRAVVEFNWAELSLGAANPAQAARHLAEANRLVKAHRLGWMDAEIERLKAALAISLAA